MRQDYQQKIDEQWMQYASAPRNGYMYQGQVKSCTGGLYEMGEDCTSSQISDERNYLPGARLIAHSVLMPQLPNPLQGVHKNLQFLTSSEGCESVDSLDPSANASASASEH